MNHPSPSSFPRFTSPLALAGVVCTLLVGTVHLQARAENTCPQLDVPDAVKQHLLADSERGIDELRRYVTITEPIYELDLNEVVAWVDARRAGRCG